MSSHFNGGKMNTGKSILEEIKPALRCILIGLFLVIVSVNGLQAAIPTSEREALISLYSATNGDNWTRYSGWKQGTLEPDGFGTIGTEGDWYGVDISDDSVTSINLTYNNLTGSIPPELANLTNLKKLYLDSNLLGGSIPPELGDLSKLEILFLGFNDNFSGSIPSELGKLTNLMELYLSALNLSGNIPSELGDLSNLTMLELRNNNLSGNIPSELGKLTKLNEFLLQNNNLSGNIPPALGNLSNLKYLSLYGNNLNGNIPPELGNLSKLETLSLGSNQLDGEIPPELGNLSNLGSLYLNSNQFSGSIPSELGKLIKLEELSLYANKLNGTIPSELGNLTILEILELNHNNLSGEIPTGLTNLINMDDLDISYNCLTTNDTTLKEWLATHDSDWSDFQCDTEHPFGSFDLPMQGSTVRSSIAVTGWTLDNWGIESVKIYREQGNTLVYIGDAVLVEGARPDVAASYPGYPNNTKAGWGYMMLTNFLPNGGNGTIVLHSIATDITGLSTTLGTKIITLDNASAVKPFGAIDTPTQGGTASGTGYVNFGWALTPQPNTIPVDGSTITVWVDGVALGNPVYNIYRSDIATLFPGYNNSNAAIGYFYLDTTNYTNGVHTIQWTVKDDAGNSDGIGSRYFSIRNNPRRASAQTQAMGKLDIPIEDIPLDTMSSIKIKTGYNPEDSDQANKLDDIEMKQIEIPELGRLEFSLNGNRVEENSNPGTSYVGYQLVANELRPLPPGSYLDKKRGLFYWQAGVAFVGNYLLVFIKTDGSGNQTRQEVKVTIKPRQ